jgi:hypothetical protein
MTAEEQSRSYRALGLEVLQSESTEGPEPRRHRFQVEQSWLEVLQVSALSPTLYRCER